MYFQRRLVPRQHYDSMRDGAELLALIIDGDSLTAPVSKHVDSRAESCASIREHQLHFQGPSGTADWLRRHHPQSSEYED